jgi:RimJ/RimL family protein N-acetyltransferase
VRLKLASCCIRNFTSADASSLATYANNHNVSRFMRDRFPHPYVLHDAVDFIQNVREQSPCVTWAIEVNSEAAGSIGIMPRTDIERISVEIGYWLAEPFWGRGIMTEVLKSLTPWAMNEFQLTRIYALPFASNAASCKVLEKAGYVCEGRLRQSAIKDGQVLDQFLYAYVADDDLARPPPGR